MRNRKLISYLVPLFISTGLIGCTTVGPDYTIPENATINKPEAAEPFAAAEENVYRQDRCLAHWWILYDDPVLTSLIRKGAGRQYRPSRRVCQSCPARAVLEEVEMGTVPTVSVSSQPKFGRNSAAADGIPERYPDRWSHDSGINISYQLDLFGKSPVVSKLPVPIPKRLRLPTIWPA